MLHEIGTNGRAANTLLYFAQHVLAVARRVPRIKVRVDAYDLVLLWGPPQGEMAVVIKYTSERH